MAAGVRQGAGPDRTLAFLIEDGADRGDISFGDDEHRKSLATRIAAGKHHIASDDARLER